MLIVVLLITIIGAVFAQYEHPQPDSSQVTTQSSKDLTLARAHQLAPSYDADVISATADLAAAEREVTRVESDPLALRIEKLQATQELKRARATFAIANLNVKLKVSEVYFAALEADEALRIAHLKFDIATTTLEATQIKYSAGAATSLDLERAENSLAAAQREVADAQLAKELAYREISSFISIDVNNLPAADFSNSDLPQLEQAIIQALASNLQLLEAEQAVELAQAQLEAIDNAFSARVEIDNARDKLANSQTKLTDIRRSLEITVQQSYNTLLAAVGSYEGALESYQTSLDDLTAQKTRLDGGSISPLAYKQSELGHAQTNATLSSARYELELAKLKLKQVVAGN